MARQPLKSLTESMFYVLLALWRQERCGTEIAAYVRQLTEGRAALGPGTLYGLYRSELGRISRCTPEEEGELLKALLAGEEGASERLVEGRLEMAALLAEDYKGRGLPVDDLVQEANMGLLLAVREYQGGDFSVFAEDRIRRSVEDALKLQQSEDRVGEELAARVNVLKDISQMMAEELGREATVEELAAKMKMTVEDIKDIMKVTLDAMSVSPEVRM